LIDALPVQRSKGNERTKLPEIGCFHPTLLKS
jgi:hypothetical protein